MKILYNPKLKVLSRNLRNQSTLSEVLVWQRLRAKQVMGLQFMRQKPIGKYIVDFYCSKFKLVIEIDGNSHASEEARKKDIIRQKYLESLGLTVLRFDDKDVKQNLDQVIYTIESWIDSHTTTP
jgi:very-short-patch-repair endonuclease